MVQREQQKDMINKNYKLSAYMQYNRFVYSKQDINHVNIIWYTRNYMYRKLCVNMCLISNISI